MSTEITKTEQTTWTTTDGEKFTSEQSATTHQQVVDALAHYKESIKLLNAAFEKVCTTKDHLFFKAGYGVDYYAVVGGHTSAPHIEIVRFSYNNWRYRVNEFTEHGRLQIEVFEDHQKQHVTYDVSELYALRHNAEKAYLDRYAEWLQAEQGRYTELQARKAQGQRIV